jgi:predicted HTH transcriptional regulator
MHKKIKSMVDVIIPIILPNKGITRGDLARQLGLTYWESTRALERLRKERLLKRRLKNSSYIYSLQVSRKALCVPAPEYIGLN